MSNIHHVQHKSEAERKHHLTAATGGDIYTLYVKNDTVNNPQHATVWCNGVTINANYPLLNTWLVSPQVCGNGTSVSISWNMVYSVSLTNTVAKDGVTFITSPSVPVPLGSTVTCTIQDGVPIFSQPLPIDAKEQIQLVLPSGTDYSSWTVGFGMGTNTVMVHQAAPQTFTFVPTPSYQIALTNEDNTNKLVAESDLTDTTPVTFAPGQKLLGVEWTVTGSWTFYDPTKPSSLSTNDPTKTLTYTNGVSGNGLRLQKRTITTTTIEEYDSSCVPPLFEPITLIIVVATMSAIAIQQAIMNRKANISLDLKIFKFDIAINQDLIDVSDHQVSAGVVPQTGFNSSTQACITDLTAALTKENVFNGQPFSVKAM